MIPGAALSVPPLPSIFEEKINRRTIPLVDFEMGGVAIGNASEGLLVQEWQLSVQSGGDFLVTSAGGDTEVVFNDPTVTEAGIAFDQQMNIVLCYVNPTGAFIRYYVPASNSYTVFQIPGATTPRITLDDKRSFNVANSDVIVAYIANNALCYRQQRDNYGTERVLQSNINASLIAVAMASNYRLQFRLLPNPTS